jgi:hypothetical protein
MRSANTRRNDRVTRWRWLALAAASLVLAGCAGGPVPLARRSEHAATLAAAAGWMASRMHTRSFEIESFVAPNPSHRPNLVVYIEGDGLAFLSPERISEDPTPIEPVALELALASPGDANSQIAYLARPCQYTGMVPICRPAYWTAQRFAPQVIDAMDDAVSQLKTRYGASRVTLVGYSGGAAVAALLAERRDDVVRLVSVAGNLSTRRWTELQALSPLEGSLDPYDQRDRLVGISQWHFVGSADSVVPNTLTKQFVKGMANANVITIDGFDHVCCWAGHWPELWQRIGQ